MRQDLLAVVVAALALVLPAGGTARPLTRIAEDNPIARYSADGRSVLVFGGGGLYLVDAASGMTRFVHSIGAHGGVDWRSRG